ncbi:hypothetical protein FNV43_RR20887 [Rhamnella rubrinervis]|uniref:Uncharacterized protein n=1 Tax=Rhamnella rubrinervis TaxID=2594499 RepID=A0A8K0GUL3_9ROSA|nr:hypothetical protein FNV43_RR20887 [Rhamnella rubrinervis]
MIGRRQPKDQSSVAMSGLARSRLSTCGRIPLSLPVESVLALGKAGAFRSVPALATSSPRGGFGDPQTAAGWGGTRADHEANPFRVRIHFADFRATLFHRRCSPWNDAVMSAAGVAHSVLRFSKAPRLPDTAACGALPASWTYLRWPFRRGSLDVGEFPHLLGSTNPCASAFTWNLSLGLQSSHLNICYYHQDARRAAAPGLAPGFCGDRQRPPLIGAQLLPRRRSYKQHPIHSAASFIVETRAVSMRLEPRLSFLINENILGKCFSRLLRLS